MKRSIRMNKIIFSLLILMIICFTESIAQSPTEEINTIFPIGNKIEGGNFVGTAWVKRLFAADSISNSAIGNVTFKPKARSNWHKHPAGQILMALNGVGYYQERGKELQILRQGDVVKCPPDVEHWHGASHNDWFVQLAITQEHPQGRVIWLNAVTNEEYQAGFTTLESQNNLSALSNRHRHIIIISSYTVKGDLEQLKITLNNGLDAGLTVNEIKEVLVHLYAYCGFPRSIQGLKTLLSVTEERKAQGIIDEIGRTASNIDNTLNKYERGKNVLETLTGQPQTPAKTGYRAFSPEIDIFLKEHLFADIFERDVLSYQDREITTLSALLNLGGVEPMLKGHMGIALNIGITESHIKELLDVVEYNIGKNEADLGKKVLLEVIDSIKK